MEGWSRDMYCDETGAALGDAVAEHADARHRDRLSRARCCSRARMLSEGRGTTRPFELVGAPWIDAEQLADAHERAGCRACTSGPWSSSRPSRSTPARPAAAARFTSPTARRSGRC